MAREKEHKESGEVTLDFEHYLIDSWDYEVDGKNYHVKKGGSPVPADKADELIKASRSTGAPLQRV